MTNEQQITKKIEAFKKAIQAKDLRQVLSLYADDIVSFDLMPPMQYTGITEYTKPWDETFKSFEGPIEYEVRDLQVTANQNLAFSHSLNRMGGTTGGQIMNLWVRWTACWRLVNGDWKVVHEQVSVPVNLENGSAVLNLQP